MYFNNLLQVPCHLLQMNIKTGVLIWGDVVQEKIIETETRNTMMSELLNHEQGAKVA